MLAKGDKPDPSKFVPIEVMQELLRDRGQQVATMPLTTGTQIPTGGGTRVGLAAIT